jgi:hypothetical protein
MLKDIYDDSRNFIKKNEHKHGILFNSKEIADKMAL